MYIYSYKKIDTSNPLPYVIFSLLLEIQRFIDVQPSLFSQEYCYTVELYRLSASIISLFDQFIYIRRIGLVSH